MLASYVDNSAQNEFVMMILIYEDCLFRQVINNYAVNMPRNYRLSFSRRSEYGCTVREACRCV